jgi:hypothetical protein
MDRDTRLECSVVNTGETFEVDSSTFATHPFEGFKYPWNAELSEGALFKTTQSARLPTPFGDHIAQFNPSKGGADVITILKGKTALFFAIICWADAEENWEYWERIHTITKEALPGDFEDYDIAKIKPRTDQWLSIYRTGYANMKQHPYLTCLEMFVLPSIAFAVLDEVYRQTAERDACAVKF